MLLSLVVWIGGLVFFAFVVAPTVFSILPTRHLAGSVVTRSLGALHWMGIVSGVVFLASSLICARLNSGAFHPFALRNVAIVLMLVLTLISQFGISPRMAALRAAMGEIDAVAINHPARVEFNRLHIRSTRIEGAVLLLGLIAVYLAARPTP
jgi:uncharacterized membrane protein